MMSPLKVLLSIISLFAVLGLIALIYPDGGIHVGEYTLRYPKLTEIFENRLRILLRRTPKTPSEK